MDDDRHENSVRLEKADGKWLVLIFENGDVTQQVFETQEFALNFASGQRLRLGLADTPN